MAVKTNITINIVEPGSDVPVPDTGLFTHGIGGTETTIIVSAALVTVLVILSIVLTTYMYRKHKKQGRTTKLVHLVDSTKAVFTNKKRVTTGLTALALLASIGTFTALLSSTNKNNTNAIEGEEGLTVNAESKELTIEVKDQPVFAVLPVQVTVEEATQAGYTLTAYTDNTDLVSTTNPNNKISMVALPETAGELSPLTDNTYGLALGEEPTTKDAEVYMPLSIDSDIPTIIKSMPEYAPTAENDTTTIYYGFYITPDIPYGTYTGSDINYNAEPHYITNLSFDGNGSDGGKEIESRIILAGDTITLPENTYTKEGYEFVDWNTAADGTGEAYADQAEYTAKLGEIKDVTLYAQWEEECSPNNICYNSNGANSPTTMSNQSATSSTGTTLWASNYKYDTNGDNHNDYGFAGWSEDKDAAAKLTDDDLTNNPKVYGPNQTFTTGDLSAKGMKLYAVWIAPQQNTSLQDFSCPTNETMPIGTVIALKDNRDNEVYTVAKLVDGNCWMTENLRLDNNATINSANTNNPVSTFTALSSSSNSWCTEDVSSCINQSMLNTNNIARAVSQMTRTDAEIYSYGNYYNWYSATAAKGTYNTGSNLTAAGDICPAGWHLPYGGELTSGKGGNTSGGFYYLNRKLGGSTSVQASKNWRSFPNNFVYSGYRDGSSVYLRGWGGYYWSSTAQGKGYAYLLYPNSEGLRPGTSFGHKHNGSSVRCVAR